MAGKSESDFPLFRHSNGQWAKKVRGKTRYFGTDRQKALERYWNEREDLLHGRVPDRSERLSTQQIIDAFLARAVERVATGDLAPVSLADYRDITKVILAKLGKHTSPKTLKSGDFAAFRLSLSARYAPSRVSKIVTVTRQIFRWAQTSELISDTPRFGPDFAVPRKKTQRLRRANTEKKLLSRDEVQSLLKCSDVKWHAILLLCLNGGLGNSDVSRIVVSSIGGQWLELPRGKTGIERRIPLWPETQTSVAEAVKARVQPKEGHQELFLSNHGMPLIVVRPDGKRTDLTSEGFRRIADAAGIHRPRMGLYWLRHTFQTIGDGAKDPVATSAIMGHVDGTMAGAYRETIDDARLIAVTEHVRKWLFDLV